MCLGGGVSEAGSSDWLCSAFQALIETYCQSNKRICMWCVFQDVPFFACSMLYYSALHHLQEEMHTYTHSFHPFWEHYLDLFTLYSLPGYLPYLKPYHYLPNPICTLTQVYCIKLFLDFAIMDFIFLNQKDFEERVELGRTEISYMPKEKQ